MKLITILLMTTFSFSSVLFAGTPVFVKNKALGFEITFPAQGTNIDVCNEEYKCLSFRETYMHRDIIKYTEVNNKCRITIESISISHADADTKGNMLKSMLTLDYRILKVKEGDENCRLDATYSENRSLTGIYL